MSLLTLSKSEKQTIDNLKTFAASFGASKIAENAGAWTLVQAIRGEAPAPKWLTKLAGVVKQAKDNKEHQDLLLKMIDTFLDTKGIDRESAVNVLRKVAPVIDLDPTDLSNDEVILSTLATVADNVYDDENNPSYAGIVKCPECSFVHLV